VTEQKNNKLLNLMKTMVEEARMEELKRTDEENDKMLKLKRRYLKDDAKVHLDTLFEDLFSGVKNFA
jgi:hypothetical protein